MRTPEDIEKEKQIPRKREKVTENLPFLRALGALRAVRSLVLHITF